MAAVVNRRSRHAEQLVHGRSVGRVLTPILPEDAAVAVDEEVAAELQGVLALGHGPDLAAAGDQLEVLPDEARPQEAGPGRAVELQGGVELPVRVGEKWERQ